MERPAAGRWLGAPVGRLVRWLERPLTVGDPLLQQADVIVVPGARVLPDGTLSRSALERVTAAAGLFATGWAPRVLLTGGAPDGPFAEADIMAREAVRLGVPQGSLLLETLSKNSWENAEFSALVLHRHRLSRAIIVTHAFHTRRMRRAFVRRGIATQTFAVPGSWMEHGDLRALELLVREYVALGLDLTGGRR